MAALFRLQVACLFVATGAAMGVTGFSREQAARLAQAFSTDNVARLEPAVAVDAAGHAARVAEQLDGGSAAGRGQSMIRHETDAGSAPASFEASVEMKNQELWEKEGKPGNCTLAALFKYRKKIANPTGASTLGTSDVASDPCAKLAAKLTPQVVHGHVVITDAKGKQVQVPVETDDETVEGTGKPDVDTTVDKLTHVAWSVFWVICFCTLLAICSSRFQQESAAKNQEQELRLKREDLVRKAEQEAASEAVAAPASNE